MCVNPEPRFEQVHVSGKGTIRSWVVVRTAFLQALAGEVPYVVAEVALDDQPTVRVLGQLVDGMRQAPSVGASVVVEFLLVGDMLVPAWRLASEA